MRNTNRCLIALSVVSGTLACSAAFAGNFASATGFVTPTELTVPLRNLCLITNGGACADIWSGTQDITLKRSDTAFTSLSLAAVNIPVGRYFGVKAGYAHGWSAKLNGVKYQGKTGTAITNGNSLWSVGTSAMSGNSVQTSSATPTTLGSLDEIGVITGAIGGTQYSVQVMWYSPACVTSDAADTDGICQPGDHRIYPDSVDDYGSIPIKKAATLSVVMDLTHAVAVDANNAALALSAQYPYIDFGGVAAVVHMASADGAIGTASGYAEMTLAFDHAGQISGIQSKSSDPFLSGNTIYARNGSGMVQVTATPAGVSLPSGVSSVLVADVNTSTGQARFPITSATYARGLITLSNVKQQAGSSVSFSCDSTTTTLAGFSWTNDTGYTACSNMASGSFPYKIVRIYDPEGVLGTCTSSSTGYSSLNGACSSSAAPYASDPDGYL